MEPNTTHGIAQTIEAEIISGRLRPGELLQQEALAKRFGVSRQPARTALEILAAKDLVSRRTDRSVEVQGLPPVACEEILSIRRLLEPEALSQAFDRLTDRDLLLARQALEHFEIEADPQNLAQKDIEFHMALYEPCGNETLVRLINDLRRTNIRAYLGQPLGSKARRACIDAHRAILAACSSRNKPEAISLLIKHFDIATDRSE